MLGFRYQYLAGFGKLREKFQDFAGFAEGLEVLIVVQASENLGLAQTSLKILAPGGAPYTWGVKGT